MIMQSFVLIYLVLGGWKGTIIYSSEIWHLPSLKTTLKQKQLSASVEGMLKKFG